MAKIVTPNAGAALYFPSGANYYKLQGLEVTPASGIYVQDLIQVGYGETTVAALPHDVDFDRDYIHGESLNGGKRGIAMNGINVTVENCYMSEFFSGWQDTQAIAGWNGPGPYKITNNYLEAGTETVAFGGAPPTIYGMIPSDIQISNNLFFKPKSWIGWVWVKNHFELKNAQRVTLDNNIFENNWVGADQRGFALVFTVRTEWGQVPWAVVKDIKITNNKFRHSGAGINFSGHDDDGSGSSSGFLVQNNTWEDINSNWGSDGRLYQILGASDITIDHNTSFQAGYLMVFDGGPSYNINFTNNIAMVGYGIASNGSGFGSSAWNGYVRGGSIARNIIISAQANQYPANNFYPGSSNDVGFTDVAGGNLNLTAASPYRNAGTDGKDIGASFATNVQATTTPGTQPAIPTGWVNIVSKNSGKCMDVAEISTNPGGRLHQWTCWGGANQAFKFEAVLGGYKITVRHSGLSLDIAGGPGATGNGAPLIQWSYWGGTNQIFDIKPADDGTFIITAAHSGKCLDVSYISKENGFAINQWQYWGGDNQKWTFVPAQ